MLRLIFLLSGFMLSGCGGGGNLASLNETFDETGANSSSTLKEYDSGDTVVALKGIFNTANTSGKVNYIFAVTKDGQTIIDTFQGAVLLESSNYTDFDGTDYYSYDGSGSNSKGQEIDTTTIGFFLEQEDLDVSFTHGYIGGHETLFTAGRVIDGVPSGIHTYGHGDVRIIYNGQVETSYNTATLVADFSKASGNLLAETDNLYLSSTNFEIDLETGVISGGESEIGIRATSDNTEAFIDGAFGGKNAAGVHGIFYEKLDSGDMPDLGVFYLVKNDFFD